jgi:hypothetical protein
MGWTWVWFYVGRLGVRFETLQRVRGRQKQADGQTCRSFHRRLNVHEKFLYLLTTLFRVFVPRRDEVTGEWIRLYSKDLYALYSSSDIIRTVKSRRLRWAGHATLNRERGAYRVLVGKPEGSSPLERPRRRW